MFSSLTKTPGFHFRGFLFQSSVWLALLISALWLITAFVSHTEDRTSLLMNGYGAVMKHDLLISHGQNSLNFTYSRGVSFSTDENFITNLYHYVFDIPFRSDDFRITVPVNRAILGQAVTSSVMRHNHNNRYFKASDKIMQKYFGGIFPFVRADATNVDSGMLADDYIATMVSRQYKLNSVALVDYVLMIPLNHEIGHTYFKTVNYNTFHYDLSTEYMSALSEYTAEYISFVGTYASILNDNRIKDKKGALHALIDLFAMSRMLSGTMPHYAATVVVSNLVKGNTQAAERDSKFLAESLNVPEAVNGIVFTILRDGGRRQAPDADGLIGRKNKYNASSVLLHHVKEIIMHISSDGVQLK